MSSQQWSKEVGDRRQSIEWITVAHVAVFVIAATWAFGGEAEWLRPPLTAWGWLGGFITLAAVLRRPRDRDVRATLWWALPMVAFNVLVLMAAANPSLTPVRHEDTALLVPMGAREGWPSSAMPELARFALLELDAIWIACLNIPLVVRHRRTLRLLLSICALNGLALAVFGTAQKLSSAGGLFFGAVPSPQKHFFASFIYHNHWGAFALLMLGVCLALGTHYARRHAGRDARHSPIPLMVLVVVIIAATIPLSASRSSTILATLLLGGTGLQYVARIIRKRRHLNESIIPPVAALAVATVIAIAGIWYVAGSTIKTRVALTVDQVTEARRATAPNARVLLYQDTVTMGMAKPWFGWGMASYPHVFTIFNRRTSPIDRLPVFYADAHSDWLQAFAEHGTVGTALLIAMVVLPLSAAWRRRPFNSVPTYLFASCTVVVVYAALEFPFANFAVVLCWWVCFFSAVHYVRLNPSPGDGGAALPPPV